jgi:hypothetical protein
MIATSFALVALGTVLCFIPGMQFAGAFMISTGVGGYLGGSLNEINGGSFENGWIGGSITGMIAGTGVAISGSILAASGGIGFGSFAAASGTSIGFGFTGGVIGNSLMQLLDSGQVNLEDALFSGSITATASFFMMFPAFIGAALSAESMGIMGIVIGTSIAIDLANTLIQNIYNDARDSERTG